MKRLLSAILLLVIILCGFTACNNTTKNEFFSEETLAQAHLSDIPIPPGIDNSVLQLEKVLYLRITIGEYEKYVSDVLTYLREREDIFYLGYSVGEGLKAEMFPYNIIAPIKDDYDIKADEHKFIFSPQSSLSENDNRSLINPVKITIKREGGIFKKYDNFIYNTAISIRTGSTTAAEWDPCEAEHTYDEGIEYIIPGDTNTITIQTCTLCGSTHYSDFIGDSTFYNVHYDFTTGCPYIINRYERHVSGILFEVQVRKPTDGDILFKVNNIEISPLREENSILIYPFIMPCNDITITVEVIRNQ